MIFLLLIEIYGEILGWTVFPTNIPRMNDTSCACFREYNNFNQISKFNMNVWTVNKHSQFVQKTHELQMTNSRVMKPTHMIE